MHLLKTDSVTVQYDARQTLLTFPDLNILPQEKILILGESGSGKTSFLSALAGFLKPTTGNVFVNGQDIYSLSVKQRDRLRGQLFGFVFQSLHLIPSLTVVENILLAGDMAGVKISEGRLEKLLSSLAIANQAAAKPAELSQGQQQRVAIARALIHSPKILIADEPTSALDDKNAESVINLLDEHAREVGAALIVATHDGRIKQRFDKMIQLTSTSQPFTNHAV